MIEKSTLRPHFDWLHPIMSSCAINAYHAAVHEQRNHGFVSEKSAWKMHRTLLRMALLHKGGVSHLDPSMLITPYGTNQSLSDVRSIIRAEFNARGLDYNYSAMPSAAL